MLYSSHVINSCAIGVYFAPVSNSTTDGNSAQGELSWGSPDTSKTIGAMSYVPVTKTYPASQYWGIDQTVLYGGAAILKDGSGIVDTGTTLILLEQSTLAQRDHRLRLTMNSRRIQQIQKCHRSHLRFEDGPSEDSRGLEAPTAVIPYWKPDL